MTRYECDECLREEGELNAKPCVVIIPGDVIHNRYACLVTPSSCKAFFKIVEETIK